MTAGVSNVVVRDDWMTRSRDGCVAEYIRGVSTGPILPLVLTPTTVRDELNVGVTYRIAGFSRQKIDGIMEMFMDQIEHPERWRHGSGHRCRARSSMAAGPVAPRRQPAMAAAD